MRIRVPLEAIGLLALLIGCGPGPEQAPFSCDTRLETARGFELLRPADADSLAAMVLPGIDRGASSTCWVSAMETRIFCTALRADSTVSDSLLHALLAHHRERRNEAGLCRAYRKAGDAWYKRTHVQRATLLLDSAIAAGRRSDDPSALANALSSRGSMALDIDLPRTAIALQQEALRVLGDASQDTVTLARVHGNLGYAYGWTGKADSIVWHHLRSIDLLRQSPDQRMMAWNRMNLSVALIDQGNYTSALELLEQALRYYEQEHAHFERASCLYYMAYCQQHVLPADHVVRTYQQVIAINDSIGQESRGMIARNALSRYLVDLDDAQCAKAGMSVQARDSLALRQCAEALPIARKNQLVVQLADVLDGLCDIERSLGLYDSSLAHAQEAIGIRERIGDKARLAGSYKDLGAALRVKGRWIEAEEAYRKGLDLIAQAPHHETAANLHQELQSLCAERGRFKEAHAHLLEAQRMRNSLMDAEKQQEVVQRQLRYEFDREQLADSLLNAARLKVKDQEREVAELRAQRAQARTWAAGGAGLLLLLGGAAFYRVDRKRRRERFAKEAAQLEAKALRAQMDPHFIGNTLHAVNAYLLANDSAAASTLLARFARWIRLMLEHSRCEEVSLQQELDAIRIYLDLEVLRTRRTFTYMIEVDELLAVSGIRVPPMLVQPLLENAIHHGFKGMERGCELKVRVRESNGTLSISVEDNGAGPAGADALTNSDSSAKHSLSGAITRERLALMETRTGRPASLTLTTMARGTRAELKLPI